MPQLLVRFVQDNSGATAIEYSLIVTLIALAIIAGATTLGDKLNTQFKNISDQVR